MNNAVKFTIVLSLVLFVLSCGTMAYPLDNWAIRDHRGAPCLYRNGKPVTPFWFWQWEPCESDIKAMTNQGVGCFSFFGTVPHYNHPYWRQDGSFDMKYQDEHIANLLRWNPKALFLPRVFATLPDWWDKANPGEQIVFHDGVKASIWAWRGYWTAHGDTMEFNRESFASEKAMAEEGVYYRKAIRHLIDTYGDNLMGIHVSNGGSSENFTWDSFMIYHPKMIPTASGDMSEPMRRAFIQFLRKKYDDKVELLRKAMRDPNADFESVRIPDRKARLELTDGAWRDPAKSRLVPDYFECHNEVTVAMMDFYCRIVKEESKNKLPTIVFYGYPQDENWPIECDHRAITSAYHKASIDMYAAPHTYYRRGLGEDGLVRQYFSSAALHGKLFVDEGDDQTHREMQKKHPDPRCYARTPDHSKAFLYREFGNMATLGTGLWYMDYGKGWFRDASLIDVVGRMKKWADVSLLHSRRRCSEVAVISAPQSEFYLGYRRTPANEIGYGLYHDQLGEFCRAGAPFDWFLADDLDAVVKGNYKVCVFLDCFYLTDTQRRIVEKLKSNNRTLLWFYAPCYVSENDLSRDRMEKMTRFRYELNKTGKLQSVLNDGTTFGINKTQNALFTVVPESGVVSRAVGIGALAGKTTLAEHNLGNWTSVYCAIPGLPRNELARIYRFAGVHLYCESDDVVTASEAWLMIHTRTAGVKKLQLPGKYRKITEITEEKFTAENVDHFEITLPRHATAVFLLEK